MLATNILSFPLSQVIECKASSEGYLEDACNPGSRDPTSIFSYKPTLSDVITSAANLAASSKSDWLLVNCPLLKYSFARYA